MKEQIAKKRLLIYENGIIALYLNFSISYIKLDKENMPNYVPNLNDYKKADEEILNIYNISDFSNEEIYYNFLGEKIIFRDLVHNTEKDFSYLVRDLSVEKSSFETAEINFYISNFGYIKIIVDRKNVLNAHTAETFFKVHNIPEEDYLKIEKKCELLAINCVNRKDYWSDNTFAREYDETFIGMLRHYIREYENKIQQNKKAASKGIKIYEKMIKK